jgi:hypothetical protein
MRILLDEWVPVQLRQALPEHEVVITQRMGWAGIGNGDLLDLAERAGIEVFIVADKNLRYQQNLSSRRIAILELWTNHRPTLERHYAEIRAAVAQIRPAQYLVMDAP